MAFVVKFDIVRYFVRFQAFYYPSLWDHLIDFYVVISSSRAESTDFPDSVSPALSSIASGWSSKLYPVSAQS